MSGSSSILIKSEYFQPENCLVKITETIILMLCLYPTDWDPGKAGENPSVNSVHLHCVNDIKSERLSKVM